MKKEIEKILNKYLAEIYPIEIIGNNQDIEKIEDVLLEEINEIYFVYYNDAANFLVKNIDFLENGLRLAAELGYDMKDVSIELLATFARQEHLKESLYLALEEIRGLL